MIPIAHIHNDLATKFGAPRQSGLIPQLEATIVFEPAFRNAEALRGLEGFSHIWLLWDFSEAHLTEWLPTVRPPRLGGNKRMGVFATRSPFRPNPIGLSSVRLTGIEHSTLEGPVLHIEGADLMNGTPILDIKPYLPFTDCHPEATAGFAMEAAKQPALEVVIPPAVETLFTPRQAEALREMLASDPRPHYQNDSSRIYNMVYAGHEVRFRVDGQVLSVILPD